MAPRRLLLVHAHPDDETLTCGATIAAAVASGVAVTLVTCTLGEEGEVSPADLAHLTADRDGALAAARLGELRAAAAALGVQDLRLLGGPRRFRDSGMAGSPAGADPRAFARADLLEAADLLVAVLREVRPQVVVTYDERGGYGHPDHVQAHRVTTYAVALAAAPTHRLDLGTPWQVARTSWTARKASWPPDGVTLPVADELVTTVVDGTPWLDRKVAALRAHATQVTVGAGWWALPDGRPVPLSGREAFRLASGGAGPAGPDGVADDLFAGLPARVPPVDVSRG